MWKAGGEFLKLMGQGIETLRCAPGIDRGFGAVQDTVDDSRDCRRRTFRDAPARSKHRDHGAFLAFAPILPKDDPPPARELDDASRGEKVEARRDVRRFVSPDRAAMRFVPSELVESCHWVIQSVQTRGPYGSILRWSSSIFCSRTSAR